MANWKQVHIDAGAVLERQKITILYESTIPLDIKKISPGCAECTTIKGYANNILTVVYKAETIPVHLNNKQGYQSVRKVVIVTYEDGSKEVLSFTVKIMKK